MSGKIILAELRGVMRGCTQRYALSSDEGLTDSVTLRPVLSPVEG